MSGPQAWKMDIGQGAMAFFCSLNDGCQEVGEECGTPIVMKDAPHWCVYCYGCGRLIVEPADWCARHEANSCPDEPAWWLTIFPVHVVRGVRLLGVPLPLPSVALKILGAIVLNNPELRHEAPELVGRLMMTAQAWGRLTE